MRRIRNEDGAVAILISLLVCFLFFPLAAVAVDLGVQRVARRDMQSLADVVALDLSREVDGLRSSAEVLALWNCDANASGNCVAAATNHVGGSVARNTSTTGDAPSVDAQLGCVDETTGTFTPVGSTCTKPNAVEVRAQTRVDLHLSGSSGGAHRTAIGRSTKTACFYLGSFAARFNANDSDLVKNAAGDVLDDVLGIDLDLVSYKGLAAADVTLADLAAQNQIGGVDQLLGGGITLGDLFAATYAVLNHENDPKNSAALSALGISSLWAGLDMAATIDLGKLLGVNVADQAALQGDFNVLDLIAGAIGIANGENLLALDDIGLAGLTDPNRSYVKVIQGLQHICGHSDVPGEAEGYSSQVQVHLEGPLGLDLGPVVPGLSTGVGAYEVDASLGHAFGDLVGPVHCGIGEVGNEDRYTVRATSGLAAASLGVRAQLQGQTTDTSLIDDVVDVPLLTSLLGLVGSVVEVTYDITVDFAATTPASSSSTDLTLLVPQNAFNVSPQGVPLTVSTPDPVQLPALPAATVSGSVTVRSGLLVVDVDVITDPGQLAQVLQPTLDRVTNRVNVNAALDDVTNRVNEELRKLGQLLGVSVGGADVYSKRSPTCNGASLIG